MNFVKKAYCRVFQTVFRIALPLLPYRDPNVLDSVDAIPALLKEQGKAKPLIVTDATLHKLGLLDGLKAALGSNNLSFEIFDETVPNPTVSNVEAARQLYLDAGCDCLIAFGGGSSIDCAKATGARIVKPHQPVSKMRGILRVCKKLPLLIAVPTTAGTGSETTLAAVITDDETHYKYPINDFSLIPHYAVLDHRITLSLPPHITSTTGIDALVHAVEAYIGRSTTKETRASAIEAVRLIDENLKRAYDDGSDAQARTNMLRAAFKAGSAFSKSYVGYVHAIAHSLGGQYGVPHGLANAIICPHVLELYGSSCHKRLGKLAREAGIAPKDATNAQASARFIQWFRDLNAYMDIPDCVSGIRLEDIPAMARKANKEANPLYPVPRLYDVKELEAIYRLIMEQKGEKAVSENSIQDIMERQRAFFAAGKTIDVGYRLASLRRLQKAIQEHEVEIEQALRDDLGKSSFESYMCEVGLTLSELRHLIKHVRSWARPQRVRTDLANFHASSFTVAEPYGVTLVMSPWNYPFMLTIEPLIGAVAAGNCCVVKPSAYSPATSAVMARLIAEVFEPGHVDVVLGGRAENAELLEQRFDYIFFTGSVSVGKLVMEKASRYLTPVSLELGGKSPAIIASDANLRLAARRVAFGKYLNCGQTCVAPDYLLIDKRVKDEFLKLLIKELDAMYGVDALANADYGKMVSQKHYDRVKGLIDSSKAIYGGGFDDAELRIQPTVMDNCTGEDPAMQEEIFGPVLPVIAVDSMEEAEAFIKEREKPLALYLFTSSQEVQDRFLQHVSFGGGCINDTIMHLVTSHMGFGGVGQSGMGSYHGKESFETFSHRKSILKKHTWIDMPLRYQPYASFKLWMIRKFLR